MKAKALLISVLALTFCMPLTSYAVPDDQLIQKEKDEKAALEREGDTAAVAKKAQQQLGVSDDQVSAYLAAWKALTLPNTKLRLTEECLAGVYGNSYGECTWNVTLVETGNTGEGFGAYQFTDDSEYTGYEEYSRNCGHTDLVTATTSKRTVHFCPHIECQTVYALTKMQGMTSRWNNTDPHFRPFQDCLNAFTDEEVDKNMKIYATYDEFIKSDDTHSAAATFLQIYEMSASTDFQRESHANDKDALSYSSKGEKKMIGEKHATYGEWFLEGYGSNKRPHYADLIYELMTGTTVQVKESDAKGTAAAMVSAGYWTEEELSEYAKLVEMNVDSLLDEATLENLKGEDLEGLSNWKRNINEDKSKGGFVGFVRILVQFFGIMFIVWMIFIYLSYWFDRINNIFYIDLLGKVTLGFLHMSDTEQECTFSVHDMGKGDRRTVNHKAIIMVCLTGIFFGVFVITGTYYKVILWIVNWVTSILGKVF